MPDPPTTRRERRQARPSFLEKLFDPERERPFLKMLFQALAPILIDFLTTKLPMMLADQRQRTDRPEDIT